MKGLMRFNNVISQHFGFTPITTCQTNTRHLLSKDDQCACGINAIAKNRITVKCNFID